MNQDFIYVLADHTEFKNFGYYINDNTLGVFTSFEEAVKHLTKPTRTLSKIYLNKVYEKEEWFSPCYGKMNGKLYICNAGEQWVPL